MSFVFFDSYPLGMAWHRTKRKSPSILKIILQDTKALSGDIAKYGCHPTA